MYRAIDRIRRYVMLLYFNICFRVAFRVARWRFLFGEFLDCRVSLPVRYNSDHHRHTATTVRLLFPRHNKQQ